MLFFFLEALTAEVDRSRKFEKEFNDMKRKLEEIEEINAEKETQLEKGKEIGG